MWIVRNTTRGRLRFPGLALSIGPRSETDLDFLGRRRAETSNQILVAFEEGYIETVNKDRGYPFEGLADGEPAAAGVTDAGLAERLDTFKQSLQGELESLRSNLAGDMRTILGGMRVVQDRLETERRRVLADETLSQTEIQARLQFLSEQEHQLERNFEAIGQKHEREGLEGGIDRKADLLSQL